ERLARPLLEHELHHRWAHAADIPGKGVLEEVLACPIQAFRPGDLGAGLERLPGEPVYLGIVETMFVGHQDSYIVAGKGYVAVPDQLASRARYVPAHGIQQLLGRTDVPAD